MTRLDWWLLITVAVALIGFMLIFEHLHPINPDAFIRR